MFRILGLLLTLLFGCTDEKGASLNGKLFEIEKDYSEKTEVAENVNSELHLIDILFLDDEHFIASCGYRSFLRGKYEITDTLVQLQFEQKEYTSFNPAEFAPAISAVDTNEYAIEISEKERKTVKHTFYFNPEFSSFYYKSNNVKFSGKLSSENNKEDFLNGLSELKLNFLSDMSNLKAE